MNDYHPGLKNVVVPPLFRVQQDFSAQQVSDVVAATQEAMGDLRACLRAGMRVGIAVGSRGIANLTVLIKTMIEVLQRQGCQVVIIPAMGSHGGATAAGQKQVLADYGITEALMGVHIISSMSTRVVGGLQYDASAEKYQPSAGGNLPVVFAQDAWECDAIIPLVRIKPHTGFRGRYESGICKMLCIGLGKHDGCSRYHREGYARFAELIPAAANIILQTGKIVGAVAVVENAHEQTALVVGVRAGDIMQREPELLHYARSFMPRILLPDIDVLIIERIGKNISGTGMDPNIIGRSEHGPLADFAGPRIQRIVVLGLTPESHGNATGIGFADLTTDAVLRAIDKNATYTNVLTSGSLAAGKMPVSLPDEDNAIRAALSCLPGMSPSAARVVRISDTLHLNELWVSENLQTVVRQTVGMRWMGEPKQ
jgi:hypothetical protein